MHPCDPWLNPRPELETAPISISLQRRQQLPELPLLARRRVFQAVLGQSDRVLFLAVLLVDVGNLKCQLAVTREHVDRFSEECQVALGRRCGRPKPDVGSRRVHFPELWLAVVRKLQRFQDGGRVGFAERSVLRCIANR